MIHITALGVSFINELCGRFYATIFFQFLIPKKFDRFSLTTDSKELNYWSTQYKDPTIP